MKKDRNSFFESSNFNMSTMTPNMNMNNLGMMGVPNMTTASSNLYTQSTIPMPSPMPAPMPNYNNTNEMQNELESRLAKIERNINRLDARLSKLEGNAFNNTPYDTDGNMYMV